MESSSPSVTYSDVPEGFTVKSSSSPSYSDVPEGFSIKDTSQQPKGDTGIISRIGEDWKKRKEMGEEAADANVSGKQSIPATYYDIFGKTMMGGASDVAKEVGKSAVSSVPEFIKKPVGEAASYVGNQIMKTPEGQAGLIALKAGQASWGNFKENHPEAARHIESTFDIAGALTGAKAFSAMDAVAAGDELQKAGKSLYESGEKAAIEKKEKFLQTLTASNKYDANNTSEKSIFGLRQKEKIPSARDKEIAQDVGKVDGVKSTNSFQGNYTAIQKANIAEAERLQGVLKENDVPIDFKDVQTAMDKSIAAIHNRSYIGADGELASRKVAAMMNNAILQNMSEDGEITASGLLQARKDFDAMALKERPNIFNPNPDSAFTASRETVYQMRQDLNNLIESKVPNEQYKASLRRQSNYYKAMENIEPKAAGEGKNILSQTVHKVAALTPGKNMMEKGGVLGATGGALYGASALGAPVAVPAAGAAALYGASKIPARKVVGYGMQKAGQGLRRLGEPVINTGTPLQSVIPQP